MASSCSSLIEVVGGGGGVSEEMKISVKERTQRFNKMASEVDLAHNKNGSNSNQERRDSKSKVETCFTIFI